MGGPDTSKRIQFGADGEPHGSERSRVPLFFVALFLAISGVGVVLSMVTSPSEITTFTIDDSVSSTDVRIEINDRYAMVHVVTISGRSFFSNADGLVVPADWAGRSDGVPEWIEVPYASLPEGAEVLRPDTVARLLDVSVKTCRGATADDMRVFGVIVGSGVVGQSTRICGSATGVQHRSDDWVQIDSNRWIGSDTEWPVGPSVGELDDLSNPEELIGAIESLFVGAG